MIRSIRISTFWKIIINGRKIRKIGPLKNFGNIYVIRILKKLVEIFLNVPETKLKHTDDLLKTSDGKAPLPLIINNQIFSLFYLLQKILFSLSLKKFYL